MGTVQRETVGEELSRFNEVTFWGLVRFGENGENESTVPLVFQIQQGRPTILLPKEVADGELRLGVQ